jgi:ABC-type glycerol-3-phosphate transport system permease component
MASLIGRARLHLYAVALIACLIAVGPMAWLLLTSFKASGEVYTATPTLLPRVWTVENYQSLARNSAYLAYGRNSIVISVFATMLTVSVSALGSFAFSRYRFKGREALFLAVLIARMIPPISFIVPLYAGVRLFNGMDSPVTLIVLDTVLSLPSAIFILRVFYDQIPREMDDSARIDGCANIKLLMRIIVPLSVPAIAMVTIFTFTGIWNEYLFAVTFGQTHAARTLPVVVANLIEPEHETSWGQVAAITMVTTFPMLFLCGYVQRYLVSGIMAGSLKG